MEKEELARLLRFESSSRPEGESVTLPEYKDRMRAGQRDIYYLAAPSRQLAEGSPYFESMKKRDVEVLFCYESYDELVLMQLQQFDKCKMTSAEKEFRHDSASSTTVEEEKGEKEGEESLSQREENDLMDWVKSQLGQKAAKVRATTRLESHPCVITLEEMAAARHFIKTQVGCARAHFNFPHFNFLFSNFICSFGPGGQLHGGAAVQHPPATTGAEPAPSGGPEAVLPPLEQPSAGRDGGGAAVRQRDGVRRPGGGPEDGAQGHERAAGGGAGQALKRVCVTRR